ncbi:MAG: xylose isomerase, partial [Acidimicrobiales bacterium]
TDMGRELDQLGRFFNLVVEHKHAIGFDGAIIIEPKPQEPAKHQYDYDTASVYAFLQRYGLEDEVQVNIEVNHASLAGHEFQHEIAYAMAVGIFGSVDANRGDDRLGWDTDQFPNSVEQLSLAMLEILRGGGFTTGGFNFDTKLRRQSIDRNDLFHGHVGAMDTLARSLLVGDQLLEEDALGSVTAARYATWDGELGRSIMESSSLKSLHERAVAANLDPAPVSGAQEALENRVRRAIEF